MADLHARIGAKLDQRDPRKRFDWQEHPNPASHDYGLRMMEHAEAREVQGWRDILAEHSPAIGFTCVRCMTGISTPHCRTVQIVARALDVRSTVAEPWRVGRHFPIHVYQGDRPVATFHQAEDAATAVECVNALHARTEVGDDGTPWTLRDATADEAASDA